MFRSLEGTQKNSFGTIAGCVLDFAPARGPLLITASLPDNLADRILDCSPDAILACDNAGTVRYWNRAAERVFGFRAAETVGASMDLIIPERLRVRHWAGWESAMKSGATRYGEGQLLAVPALHRDGRQISIEFSIQLLKGADGAVEWVVAFIRDVTERYNRERALRNELAALSTKSPDRHEADPRASPGGEKGA